MNCHHCPYHQFYDAVAAQMKDIQLCPNATEKDNSPETVTIQNFIYPDHIKKFTEIESELIARGFIDASYKWKTSKRDLLDLCAVLIDYNFFRKNNLGKRYESWHYRHFLSQRYGLGGTGLSGMAKQYKPNLQLAKNFFYWIH